MKVGMSLLLVFTVAVAGIAMWFFGVDPAHPFRSTDANVRQEPEPPPEAPVKAKQVAKLTRPRIPQTRAVIEAAPPQPQKVTTAAPILAGDEIPAGTPKETIVKMYGDLALSIRRLDRGHDLETLVYARDHGKNVTVILLEDGKVSSAYTRRRQPDEHTAGLLAGPTAPQPASSAIPPIAEAPGRPLVQANVGTCGEYRDGKLTVKPCSPGDLNVNEWPVKGTGGTATESVPLDKH